MIKFNPLVLEEARGSFLDIFTSNVAIIVYIIIFAVAIIAIAILFIVNESLTNEKISKIEGGDPLMNALKGQQPAAIPAEAIKDTGDSKKKKESGDRFQKLILLDKQYPKKEYVTSTEDLTLEYLCRRFRSFASRIAGNPLYYSIDDIRRFIAALGVTKIMILQGMSGTGKTSLPVAWGKFTRVPTTVVPVQPMWKERSDLIGYFNEFTGKFNESMILEKLYEANKTNRIYLIVLDEMNIARVEYYFAEFLSLHEKNHKSKKNDILNYIRKMGGMYLIK